MAIYDSDIVSVRRRATEVSKLLKSIANRNRLIIVCLLLDGEKTVGQLTERLQISQPAVSQMLIRMKQENVLESRQDSQKVYYKLVNKKIIEVVKALEDICVEKRLPE